MSIEITRIRDESLSEKVINQLLLIIRSGKIAVGDKLPPESELAAQLGVSRGILREALSVMETLGFLRRVPREGTTVIRIHEDDLAGSLSRQLKKATLMDLLEFRETMERKVVEKVIELATDEEIRELEDHLESKGTQESKDYYFHYRLALLSGNTLFATFIDTYYDLIKEVRDISARTRDRAEQINEEHLRIVSALKNRDKKAAKKAVRDHLNAVGKIIGTKL